MAAGVLMDMANVLQRNVEAGVLEDPDRRE